MRRITVTRVLDFISRNDKQAYITILMKDHGSDWMSDSRVAEVKKDSGKINPQNKESMRKHKYGKDADDNTVD